jgi:hypothetical protein
MKTTNRFKSIYLSLALILTISGCGSDSDKETTDKTFIDDSTNNSSIISEILASNSLQGDPDFAEFSDWIELRNTTSTVLDLSGYGLSDTDKEIKWLFPQNTTIEPGAYLIVWADDQDSNLNALHTNFKLSAKKDSVVLYDANGNLIEEVKFKDQRENISFSINDNDEFIRATPTLGTKNTTSEKIVSQKPILTPQQGVYEDAQTVTITAAENATIHYTRDGKDPTSSSAIYNSPLEILDNETIKAIAIESGGNKLISKVKNVTYVISQTDVVINEILADNNSTNTDPEFNEYGDWIELYNKGDSTISLDGFGISDGKKGAKWTFPAGTSIDAGEYLLVWADDKNGTTSLHTNFKLNANEDTAALFDTNNKLIDFIEFKDQEEDISLSKKGANNFIKVVPTPGKVNN